MRVESEEGVEIESVDTAGVVVRVLRARVVRLRVLILWVLR